MAYIGTDMVYAYRVCTAGPTCYRKGRQVTITKSAEAMIVGTKIDNGAIVLVSKLNREDDLTVEYVALCLWRDEYVTWHVGGKKTTGETSAYWGHYFGTDIGLALADYRKRAGEAAA